MVQILGKNQHSSEIHLISLSDLTYKHPRDGESSLRKTLFTKPVFIKTYIDETQYYNAQNDNCQD